MNKHLIFLIIINFLTTSYTMQQTNTPLHKKIGYPKNIPTKSPALTVKFLDANTLAIGTTTDCNLINISTGAIIEQLSQGETCYLVTDHEKKRLAIISDATIISDTTCERWKLLAYNLEKKQIIWQLQSKPNIPIYPVFSPTDNSIFVHTSKGFIDNYGNKYKLHKFQDTISCVSHPTKKEILCINARDNVIFVMDPNSDPFITTSYKIKNIIGYISHDINYSSDGNYITFTCAYVCNHSHGYWYDPTTNTVHDLGDTSFGTTFHPNSSIVAVQREHCIEYWDSTTKKTVASTHDFCLINYKNAHRSALDFSPDGTQLAAVTDGQCHIFDVPFDVIYDSKTKNKFIFTYYALQCYRQTNDNIIPQEIIQLLMHKLFKSHTF